MRHCANSAGDTNSSQSLAHETAQFVAASRQYSCSGRQGVKIRLTRNRVLIWFKDIKNVYIWIKNFIFVLHIKAWKNPTRKFNFPSQRPHKRPTYQWTNPQHFQPPSVINFLFRDCSVKKWTITEEGRERPESPGSVCIPYKTPSYHIIIQWFCFLHIFIAVYLISQAVKHPKSQNCNMRATSTWFNGITKC